MWRLLTATSLSVQDQKDRGYCLQIEHAALRFILGETVDIVGANNIVRLRYHLVVCFLFCSLFLLKKLSIAFLPRDYFVQLPLFLAIAVDSTIFFFFHFCAPRPTRPLSFSRKKFSSCGALSFSSCISKLPLTDCLLWEGGRLPVASCCFLSLVRRCISDSLFSVLSLALTVVVTG